MAEIVEVQVIPPPEPEPIDPTLVSRRPRKVYAGMWGPLEIGAVAAGALALVAAIALYLLFVVPSDREVARDRSEADRLDAERITAQSKYGQITSTEAQVSKLLLSADDFETRFLPASANGQTALYQRLNGLIAAYGLTNTTGPDYQPLDPIANGTDPNRSDDERGREKFRSLFPGVYVTVTLEGPYQNLRRFIRDVETGNEFIVISSVELAPSDTEKKVDPTKPPPATAAGAAPSGFPAVDQNGFPIGPAAGSAPQSATRQQGKTHGEVVALRLEMAAYFRRPNFAPASVAAGGAE